MRPSFLQLTFRPIRYHQQLAFVRAYRFAPWLQKYLCRILLLLPVFASAQQTTNDSLKTAADTIKKQSESSRIYTRAGGTVTDAATGQPIAFINIGFTGSKYGTSTDSIGRFNLIAPGSFSKITFSYIGYQTVTKIIKPGQLNNLQIKLQHSQTALKEVAVVAGKHKHYTNKNNPAVALIQQIIDHKAQNRMTSSDYLQYDQYERISLSFTNLPAGLMNSRYFKMYQFMLDTIKQAERTQVLFPAYVSEKLSKNYYRKNPAKAIRILSAEKEVSVMKFIDTAGLDIYLNRLYGNNIDMYDNNIFIISNQFLSPIADHAPDFYKFFIVDTVQRGKDRLVNISFTPRAKGDLLFEGHLLVTLDGHYAVQSADLQVNRQININFMRSLDINLSFKPDSAGHYQLTKSVVKADFGLLKNKGFGVMGERTVVYSNYLANTPQTDSFYQGKALQILPGANKPDTAYWESHRADTLSAQQSKVYAKVNRLEQMPQFKRATWIASTLTGGYAQWGPVQLGPIGAIYSFNSQEGSRFQVGGRTTPAFNKNIYLQGFAAYGTTDKQLKYNFSTYFALNQTPFYRYPNNYFKINYFYDVGVPGQSFSINNQQAALSSFHSGKTDYWLYSRIFKVDYVKEFENHFSFDIDFKNWDQLAAGTLVYRFNDPAGTVVQHLVTSEAGIALRYAPHEQILQGTESRRTIHSKYPIFNLQINHGFKDVLNGSYSYTSISTNIYKRFYMSQLGYGDVTLLGGMFVGKAPFPLLSISPANQSIAYDPDAYNQMTYLEFVSDHYAGINFTQSFNGFFLNKIPLIAHLKWREYLSAKILYGGLRNENNPRYSANLYQFPVGSDGSNGTFALGSTPYIEAGAGIGNIFKFLRVDGIKRFNYLDHPGASKYGIKLSFSPDF